MQQNIKIKVKYNPNTNNVTGYYPSNINYKGIDEKAKTITDEIGTFPYIEINEEEQILNSEMIVKNGKYTKYIPSNAKKIEAKKQQLLHILDRYHYSEELRKITVNESIIINYHLEFRQLIDEQIINLQLKLDLGQVAESDASFTYIDINNVDVILTLEQLKKLSVELKEIANSQWKIYIATKKEIEATETLKALESLDIERAYMKSINITI